MPRPSTVQHVRYWVVVILRGAAVVLIAVTVAQLWNALANVVELVASGRAQLGAMNLAPFVFSLVFGPGATAAAAALLVRLGPAIARWIVPLPRDGCPECGYPVPRLATTCPECGLQVR